eukprot:tig00020553_g10578.t1
MSSSSATSVGARTSDPSRAHAATTAHPSTNQEHKLAGVSPGSAPASAPGVGAAAAPAGTSLAPQTPGHSASSPQRQHLLHPPLAPSTGAERAAAAIAAAGGAAGGTIPPLEPKVPAARPPGHAAHPAPHLPPAQIAPSTGAERAAAAAAAAAIAARSGLPGGRPLSAASAFSAPSPPRPGHSNPSLVVTHPAPPTPAAASPADGLEPGPPPLEPASSTEAGSGPYFKPAAAPSRGFGKRRGAGRRKVAKVAKVHMADPLRAALNQQKKREEESAAASAARAEGGGEEFDGILVRQWGRVVWNKPGFHDEKLIYPAGYRCEFDLPGPTLPTNRTTWLFEIMDVGDFNPMFKAVPLNDPKSVDLSADLEQLWSRVKAIPESLLSLPGVPRADRLHFTKLDGYMFGLRHPEIRRRIKALPNVDKCQRFEDSEASSDSESGEEEEGREGGRRRKRPAPRPSPNPYSASSASASASASAPPAPSPSSFHEEDGPLGGGPCAAAAGPPPRIDFASLVSHSAALSLHAAAARAQRRAQRSPGWEVPDAHGRRSVETQTVCPWPWLAEPPYPPVPPPPGAHDDEAPAPPLPAFGRTDKTAS